MSPLVDGNQGRAGGRGIYWLWFLEKRPAGRKAANRTAQSHQKSPPIRRIPPPATIRARTSRLDRLASPRHTFPVLCELRYIVSKQIGILS
jgi:hypothetical protein